jgi:TetR/AcrR family transcriptional regulator, regulator of mycofactocin system
MERSESLRERKKADARRRMMDAALRLFGERGFDNTSVEDIAAAADVAPRTFFRYFPAKVDVLFADHDAQVSLLRETLADRSSGETVVCAVRRATLTGVERLVDDPAPYLTRSRLAATVPAAEARSRQLDADYENAIAEALAVERNVEAATDLPVRAVARAAWSATRAARDVWLASEGKRDPRELIDEAFDVLERGLA